MKFLKNLACIAYMLAFFAACATPGVMLFLPDAQTEGEVTSENRMLAAAPQLLNEDGSFNRHFSADAIEYVSDHFGFRSELVALDAMVQAEVLGVSAEPKVTIGQNGWLYYTQTLNDATGVPTISPLGIRNIVYNLRMSDAYVRSQDAKLIVAVVPNKASIYPQYLPYNYRISGVSGNYGNLSAAVKETELCWCDLYTPLKTAADTSAVPIYHKLDTHWNNLGALIGCRAILDCTEQPYDAFTEAYDAAEQTHDWEGDLQTMLFPGSDVRDDQYTLPITFDYQYQGHFRSVDDLVIQTEKDGGEGHLLMFRDSFARAAMPYLSEQFAAAKYCRTRPNPYYNLESEDFDFVVMEIAERNIAWLQKEAPVHPAPAAEPLPKPHAMRQGTLQTAQNGSMYLQIYGTLELPEGLDTACDYVVTLTAPDGTAQSYLAYHCYESDLLGEETIGDNGYSLYIPAEDLLPETAYQVELRMRTPKQIIGYDLGTASMEAAAEP